MRLPFIIFSENTLVRKYENFIREIINSSISRIDWDKLESQQKMFVDKMKELFNKTIILYSDVYKQTVL